MAKLENRSLHRGILLLETLARRGSCSLADLSRHSGLAKSTIRRMLATLIDHRLVRKSLSDGRYRINITLPVSSGEPVAPELALLVDVALPYAVELTQDISWPSDIHIIDGDQMRIVESTRPLSPFHLYRGVVNRTVNMFGSAAGRACLAAMDRERVARYHERSRGDPRLGLDRFGLSLDDLHRILATIRKQGYATRRDDYFGETVLDDGLAAIAVPIGDPGRPIGAVSLLWPRLFKPPKEMAADYLPKLLRTAESISADLRRYKFRQVI